MAAFVIDTNVPIGANGKSHADPDCVIACVEALINVQTGGVIVIDDAMLILKEYLGYLSLSGEPGAGDAFIKWVWSVQGDDRVCARVPITPRPGNGPEDYVEFPNDPELTDFDPADRKFVAVALASAHEPSIVNALDSDWANSHAALIRNGLTIRFLCPQHVSPP